MLQIVAQNLKRLWRPLVVTDLLFKALAFVLLTPVVGFLFRLFLSLSGRTVLADADIAQFFLHPIGWLTAIVVGGATVSVLALEQAVLISIGLASMHGRSLTVRESFQFVASHVSGVFHIAARMVGRVLLISAPFLAVGGGLYLWLLTKHDINYYLSEKPPQFWLAGTVIGGVLLALAVLLVRCIVNWSIAVQLHLFEGVSPRECLEASHNRVYGHRKTIAFWIVGWLTVTTLISSVGSASVVWLGKQIVPYSASHLWLLTVCLGAVLVVLGIVNLATSLLSVITLALVQTEVYDRFGRTEACVVPGADEANAYWWLRWNRRRVIAVVLIAVAVAGCVGGGIIHSIRLDDNVQVTAHRGASGKAPENTLASVRQAIEDGTDWVEIDVQESSDGVVVVAHDSDLMKVAGVATKIWEGTAEDLRSIDIGSYFGAEFKDERVPTLAEVLQECRGRVGLNIELKYYGHDQDLERKVVDLVEQNEMASNVVIMSLKAAGIKKIKALRPNWTVGLLTAVKVGDLTKAEADFLAVNSKIATRSFINSANAREKQVYVWTVDDAISMSTMISRGADNLITDHPELAREVLKQRAEMSPVQRILVELALLLGAAEDLGIKVSSD